MFVRVQFSELTTKQKRIRNLIKERSYHSSKKEGFNQGHGSGVMGGCAV